jgi:hypothetical protein
LVLTRIILRPGPSLAGQQLAAVQSNKALALGPFVSVDPNPEVGVIGPNIIFSGANIHIVSGSGATNDMVDQGGTPTGLGNLIIGYDERGDEPPFTLGHPPPFLTPGARGGSHNLVIGRAHRFTTTSFGGFVAGEFNTISNGAASVTGGFVNTASGAEASVTGGAHNIASDLWASVSGGETNHASAQGASVTGGVSNTASGVWASVLGGHGNTASGFESVVIGGTNITDNKDNSIAPQPPFP